MIATNETHTVRECVEVAFDEAGLGDWERYVEIDPQFVRPAEVDHLIGDYAKAERDAGLEAGDELRGAHPADDAGRPRTAQRLTAAEAGMRRACDLGQVAWMALGSICGRALPRYHAARYNLTFINERTVEVPIALRLLRRYAGQAQVGGW